MVNTLIIAASYIVGAVTYSITDAPGFQGGGVLLASIALGALVIISAIHNDR